MSDGRAGSGGHRRLLIVAAVVVALLVVAGIAVLTATLVASRGTSAAPASGTSTVIGDEHTVDPCSLVDPGVLTRFGSVKVVRDYEAPDTCAIDVKGSGPGDVALFVQLQNSSTDVVLGPRQQIGPYMIARPDPGLHDCGRTMLIPGGVWLVAEAAAEHGSTADLCAHSEAAIQSALGMVNAGRVVHRPLVAAPGSLVDVDACSLLDADTLTRVGGVDPDRVEHGFGGWRCRWGATTDQNEDPPVVALTDDFQGAGGLPPTVRIAGRDVAILPDGDSAYWHACVARLPQRIFTGDDGSDRVESLKLTVYAGPQQTSADASCDRARALVPALAARLPAPH